MARPTQPPKVHEESIGKCDPHEVYEHPAYGTVGISITTGGDSILFGSDVTHNSRVSLKISRAKLARNLSNDWVHSDSTAIIEVDMSHHQFAEMITNPNRGSGTPCTIRYENGHMVPGIERIENANDLFKREITASARKSAERIDHALDQIGNMIESGNISKAKLRELHRMAKDASKGFGGNVGFVVEQGVEALEKAATSVKMDIEASVNHYVRQLGVDVAKEIGLVTGDSPTSIEHTIEVNPETKRLTRSRK